MFDYSKYLKSLAEYMSDNGYTVKPFPKFILDNSKQDEELFIMTGCFDPNAKGIRLFIRDRHPKDVLRTAAHELIHWKQDKTGAIEKSGYKGDQIINDKSLEKLESEAYLKGNIAFRKWTEYYKNKKNIKQ